MEPPDQARRAAELFEAALDMDGDRRAAFLTEACANAPALRAEVDSLLVLHGTGKHFLDSPAPWSCADFTESAHLRSPEAQDSIACGTRLGPYEIIAPLGAGGMGSVYRGRDTRLDREVAVKVLPQHFADRPERRARFDREARAVAALSHPNILAIHDYGRHEAVTYAVMELLHGETLRSRLARGPMPWPEAAEVGAAIAEGLAAAHAKGIVHRDLKPDNLFLTAVGGVKILDFGLARFTNSAMANSYPVAHENDTQDGAVLGTAGYMSPEQVRGDRADARTDIFSFGCVLHEMLTGRRAFQRPTPVETMTAILHDEPPSCSTSSAPIPEKLKRFVTCCLAKDSNLRLRSARDLVLELLEMLREADRPLQPAARRFPWRIPGMAAAVIVLIAVTAASVKLLTTKTPITNGDRSSDTRGLLQALAVLPFENVGSDPKSEFLSDGLTDHLISSLGRVRRQELMVRPFTSVSRYKRNRPDVLTMGRALNVGVIVTGTLHQQGVELSIGVELVDAVDDNRLWGKRYQGTLDGILDLQDEIARDVAENLRQNVTGDEAQRLTKRTTEDLEAYLYYREAVYHFYKFTEPGLDTAIEYCLRALKEDPDYALAYVGLGRCYVLLGTIHRGPRNTHPQAREFISQALQIDPELPDAYTALAVIHLFHDWDWPAAENALQRAMALDSQVSNSRNMYGFYLAAMGRLPEALASIRFGREIEPLVAPRRNELAMCYNWMRRFDQAIAEARRALELDPNFPVAYAELAIALVESGAPTEAIAELHQAVARGQQHPRVRGMLGYAYAVAGDSPEAEKVVEDLEQNAEGRFGFALPISRIHAALGDKDQAFEWLQKAADERDPHVIWINVDPTMDPLRSDPRFDALLRRMGLAGKMGA